jgi:hypothetical protein
MREFFDHRLMGKPAPGWLKEGVPHRKLDDHLKERGKQVGVTRGKLRSGAPLLAGSFPHRTSIVKNP